MEEEDKQALLKLARESIESHYNHKEPDISNVLHLNREQGAFVTLHKNNDLRGCIGYVEAVIPLFKVIIEAAKAAALNDPRFPMVTPDEMRNIKIEISVLSVPEELKVETPDEYTKKINIGEDGLIIRSPHTSGLLLPQVATEQHWTTKQFLNAVCQKANLPFSAWENLENKLFTFQADVFSE